MDEEQLWRPIFCILWCLLFVNPTNYNIKIDSIYKIRYKFEQYCRYFLSLMGSVEEKRYY